MIVLVVFAGILWLLAPAANKKSKSAAAIIIKSTIIIFSIIFCILFFMHEQFQSAVKFLFITHISSTNSLIEEAPNKK